MQIKSYVVQAATALLLASPMAACTLGGATDQSALSGKDGGGADGDCTFTQGYWKNHPDAWPVSSLTLGSRSYDKAELIAILKTPIKGNGLVQLAHQLIAAKLNLANGASDVDVAAAIAQADALIGSLVVPPVGDDKLRPRETSALNDTLDAFDNGKLGPGHCDKKDEGDDCDHDDDGDCDHGDCDHDSDCDEHDCDHDSDSDCDGDTCDHGDCDHDDDGHCDGSGSCDHGCDAPACGDGVVEGLELCDDGNTTNGDGCSSTCTIELPVCGNGVIDVGETCDDGNTQGGDGCSSVCVCEPC